MLVYEELNKKYSEVVRKEMRKEFKEKGRIPFDRLREIRWNAVEKINNLNLEKIENFKGVDFERFH